jgi:AAA15 family ATPase/GTPase
MIESAELENFRCFERVTMRGCKRINVIVGKNASGKTALLEALFLAVGPSPELATRFKRWRSFEQTMGGTQEDIEKAMWSDLFYRLDLDRRISVSLQGSGPHTRSLTIDYGRFDKAASTSASAQWAPSPILFRWINAKRRLIKVRPQFTGLSFEFHGAEHPPVEATFFASTYPVSNQENVKRFSVLSKVRGEENLVEAIRREFPFIHGIDIQSYAGVSMLHADIPSLPEKIPLNLVSSGVAKLTTLLLAVTAQPSGVLFVDEIENGFHYERYESIWRAINNASSRERPNVQLFASTHSQECLQALARAFKEDPEDLAIIQVTQEKGISVARVADGADAIAAIEGGIEIRR